MSSDSNSEVPWRRNLAVMWVAQAATVLSFTFTFPFFALFFKDLGIDDPGRAAFIAGVSGWALGLGMAIFSPIWGVIGDRFGRKLNVVRATAMGAVVLGLSGFAQNPEQLIASRFFAGALAGVGAAMLALVAAGTPRRRVAFATGVLQSGMFFGGTIGPVVGGLLFETYGMRIAFFANGIGLAVPAILVQLFVREGFVRPVTPLKSPFQPFRDLVGTATSREFWPLFVVVFFVHAALLVTFPALPVIVEAFTGEGGAATGAGIVFMSMGAANAISAITTGYVGSRFGLKRTFAVLSVCAAGFYLLALFANSVPQLALLLGAVGLMQGGLVGIVNGLIAIATPEGKHGAVFGASQTVMAMAIALGPLAGGAVAFAIDLKAVFVLDSIVFAVTAVVALLLVREVPRSRRATTTAPIGTQHATTEAG